MIVTISWQIYFQLSDNIIKPARGPKMKKSDHDVHEKTASWSILQSEWLKKCGRLLLLLLYRFAIGWAFFQLLTIIVAGILLLGVLLF
ncbi:hypothetical protein C1Q48_22050, partial [Salmonella enterica]|nr:hypothetical protein [Salmonella enterica]